MATGLVVDDAIVVIENIARHRAMGKGPRAAAVIGTREIVFAVLATTATLAAVFIPVSFMPGVVGSLFSEFGFVLAFAVTISSLTALTLCPMLAAKLGTGDHGTDPDANPGPARPRRRQAGVELCLGDRHLPQDALARGRSLASRSLPSAGPRSSCCRTKSRPPRIAASCRSG